MAKVVLATMGSLGDLYPFLSIGRALQAIGHTPLIVTNDVHQAKVEASGLAFRPMRPSLAELHERTGLTMGELVARAARDPWFLLEDVYLPFTPAICEDIRHAARGAALIVTHNWVFGAIIAAEVDHIPLVRVAMSPIFLQSAIRPSVTGGVPYAVQPRTSIGIAYNRIVRNLARRQIRKKMAPAYALRRRLGLAETDADFVFDFGQPDSARSILAPYSPQLAGVEPDHPSKALISGFPHFAGTGSSDDQLSPALLDFLRTGPAPVVLTLGSFVVSGCADFYRNGLAACRALGRRSILVAGAEEAERLASLQGPDTFICAYAPHAPLFPRAAAIVHHGGIGTTGQAMLSGKPQLIVPSLGDQMDNARRLVELGVARQLKPGGWNGRNRCSVGRLRRGLQHLLGNRSYAEAGTVIAKAIAHENGATAAARHLDSLIAGELAAAA